MKSNLIVTLYKFEQLPEESKKIAMKNHFYEVEFCQNTLYHQNGQKYYNEVEAYKN